MTKADPDPKDKAFSLGPRSAGAITRDRETALNSPPFRLASLLTRSFTGGPKWSRLPLPLTGMAYSKAPNAVPCGTAFLLGYMARPFARY